MILLNACKPTPDVPVLKISTDTLKTIADKPVKPTEYKLEPVLELPSVLRECSGMIELSDGRFLAHNDSGNKPYLYLFSSKKEDPKIIKVKNVANNDWEEITEDDDYIYIGDFGNNGGTRQNLMIYKIKKSEIHNQTEVTPEIIKFRYNGQTKFSDSNRHNFDCEAMITKGDSLYLFSKNRGDFRTDVYGLPKAPGEYVTSKMGSFDSEGLVTGADFREHDGNGELVLVGYSIHGKAVYPFILYFPKVSGTRFLEDEVQRIDFRRVLQTESILFHSKDKVYLTNEEEDNSEGFIYEVKI